MSLRRVVLALTEVCAFTSPAARAEAKRAAGCSFDEFLEQMKRDDEFDAPLTALGVSQAEAAHASLPDDVRPGLVLVSPLSRAIETALRIFPATPFVAHDDLRERSGWLINTKRRGRSQLEALYPAIDFASGLPTEHDELWTEALEEWASCSARGRAALEYAWTRPEREVALVCHGGVLDAILSMRDDIVADEALQRRFHNAELRSASVCRDDDGIFRLSVPEAGAAA